MIQVRKKILNIETTHHEGGEAAQTPLQIGLIAVVVNNPFAGRFAEASELAEFVKQARNLANEMVPQLVAALGGASHIETYGKGAIVGVNGELEHGATPRDADGPRRPERGEVCRARLGHALAGEELVFG